MLSVWRASRLALRPESLRSSQRSMNKLKLRSSGRNAWSKPGKNWRSNNESPRRTQHLTPSLLPGRKAADTATNPGRQKRKGTEMAATGRTMDFPARGKTAPLTVTMLSGRDSGTRGSSSTTWLGVAGGPSRDRGYQHFQGEIAAGPQCRAFGVGQDGLGG